MWYFHKAYRDIPPDENEIAFPGGHINFYSCKWSFIIKRADISKVSPNFEKYRFCYFKEINSLKIVKHVDNQTSIPNGRHLLTCKIFHKPEACNFSHIEIHINHKIFDPTNRVIFDKTYTKEEWDSRNAHLNKQSNQTMKSLKKDYRLKLLQIISRDMKENGLGQDWRTIFHL